MAKSRRIARHLTDTKCLHPLRIAIDGVEAAGKTTVADELALQVEALGRPVIRASIDGFYQPRGYRYRRGALSPEGYYQDSFNYHALHASLLDPSGPDGNRCYRSAAFDNDPSHPCMLFAP